jgi:hypothetical protein
MKETPARSLITLSLRPAVRTPACFVPSRSRRFGLLYHIPRSEILRRILVHAPRLSHQSNFQTLEPSRTNSIPMERDPLRPLALRVLRGSEVANVAWSTLKHYGENVTCVTPLDTTWLTSAIGLGSYGRAGNEDRWSAWTSRAVSRIGIVT